MVKIGCDVGVQMQHGHSRMICLPWWTNTSVENIHTIIIVHLSEIESAIIGNVELHFLGQQNSPMWRQRLHFKNKTIRTHWQIASAKKIAEPGGQS